MLKHYLIQSLLVLVAGVLATACGGSGGGNGGSNDADKDRFDDLPRSFRERRCDNCSQIYLGRFRIFDEGLYKKAFGHSRGFNLTDGDGPIDNLINDIARDMLSVGAGIIACGTKIFFTEVKARAFSGYRRDKCKHTDTDFLGYFGDNDLKESYPARVRVRYRRGVVEEVALTIDSNLDDDGRDDSEVFRRKRSDIFVSSDGALVLRNLNRRLQLGTSREGRVFGEFIGNPNFDFTSPFYSF